MFFGKSNKTDQDPSIEESSGQEEAEVLRRSMIPASENSTPSFPKLPAIKERTYTILAADDEKDCLILLQAMLADASYKIITAADGVKALELYGQVKPDLVILDVQMPGKSGFEVCKEIKSQQASNYTPVFLVTCLDDPYVRIEGLKQGADDYITKPYFTEELQIKVASFLRIKDLTQELVKARDELAENERKLTMKLYDLGKL